MGKTFLKPGWLAPDRMQRWQRTALKVLKGKVPRAGDVVWVLSSGTQAVDRIKAVGLSFDAIMESARAVNAHLGVERRDVWSVEIPIYHVGGFSIFARAHLMGSKVVRGGAWNPARFAKRVESRGITLTSLVPTQVFDLVHNQLRAPQSLRAVVVGGGALENGIYTRARELGWPLLPSYGLTECSSQVATASLDSLAAREFPGLTVLPHARVDFRAQQVYVQCLSVCRWIATASESDFTMEDPLRDGWLATEDLGEWKGVPIAGRSPQIRILGRRDEVIKVFGVLVSLPQVEADFREWCRSRRMEISGEWALVSVGGGREGSRIFAAVAGPQVPPEGRRQPSDFQEAVRAYNGSVAGPYRIHSVVEVPEIPRTQLGKVRRAELAIRLGAEG